MKAQPLLDELAAFDDPQIALRLPRNFAAFGKRVYAARAAEFGGHDAALTDFDSRVRTCFEGLAGLSPTNAQ